MTDWTTMTQAERDAAYNNTEAVPRAAEHSAARIRASAAVRARFAATLDLPYGDRERNRCDVFPAADPAAPCLVFIHGGYWQRNSHDGFASLTEGVRAHGWAAAVPGYTLAPEASLAEIVAEVHAALDWLRDAGSLYGVTGKLVVAGWSAGGHLAALGLEHEAAVAGMGISGVYELAPVRDTYLNVKLNLAETEIVALSPIRRAAVAKPFAVAYGSTELPALVATSRDYHAARAGAHTPGALIPLAGRDHFTVLDELVRPDGVLTRQLLDLIGRA